MITNDIAVSTINTAGCERVEEIRFDNSGLDWEIRENEMFDPDMNPIKGWKQLQHEHTNHTIHVAKNSYGVVQNERLWEAMDQGLIGVDYKVVSSGSYNNCKSVFIKVDIEPEQNYVVGNDQFHSSMMFCTSHDGTGAVHAFDCNLRLVCMNQLRSAIRKNKNNEFGFTLKHTRNANKKMRSFGPMIEATIEKRAEFYTSLEYLQSLDCNDAKAKAFIRATLAPTTTKWEDVSTRVKNNAEDVFNRFKNGDGNNGETYYDLLNGFTEHWTRCNNSKDTFKNFVSSEFGTGAKRKRDVFTTLLNRDKTYNAINRGLDMVAA